MFPKRRRNSSLLLALLAALWPFCLVGCGTALQKSAETLRNGAVLAQASPSGLRAIEANHRVLLDWDKVEGATGYTLYWSTNPAALPAEANAVSLTTNSYIHTGLQNGKGVYYSVVAHGFDTDSRVTDTILAVPHQYMVYVNNGGVGGLDCNTLGYAMDSADGSLAESDGSPFDVGSYPVKITTDPLRRFAYISSFNTQQITCYTIDPDTGRLAPVGSPVSAGSGVSSLAVDPTGKYLYAVNSTGTYPGGSGISAYAINQDSGFLTTIPGSPFDTGVQPQNIVIDPTGRFAYVPVFLTGSGRDVVVFKISDTGALEKLAESFGAAQGVDYGVYGIAMHPNGKFLYLTFWNNSTGIAVQAFTLNTSTGGLLAGQATRKYNLPETDGGNHARAAEIDPTGRYLYICMNSKRKIAIYSIDQASGDLSPLDGSPFQLWPATPAEVPNAIGFDPEGKFAYIVTSLQETPFTGTLRRFSIDQETGRLSAVGAPLSTGKNTCDLEIIHLP